MPNHHRNRQSKFILSTPFNLPGNKIEKKYWVGKFLVVDISLKGWGTICPKNDNLYVMLKKFLRWSFCYFCVRKSAVDSWYEKTLARIEIYYILLFMYQLTTRVQLLIIFMVFFPDFILHFKHSKCVLHFLD